MISRDELLQLIERLEAHAELHDSLEQYDLEQAQWGDDLRKAATTIRGLLEQKPVAEVAYDGVSVHFYTKLPPDTDLYAEPVAAPAQKRGWKEVVIEKLMVSHIYRNEHDSDPDKALNDLIAWQMRIALDPQVSSDAQALIDKGKKEAAPAQTLNLGAHLEKLG
jgi:hypothetical protein